MNKQVSNLLLVEDDKSYMGFLNKLFKTSKETDFTIKEATSLSSAVDKILNDSIDVILLDLNLPDSDGINTLIAVKNCAPDTPVIILTGDDDKSKAMESLRLGAQDYFLKGEDFSKNIVFKVEYALERYKSEENLRSLIFIDELSGLYNFRGFKAHAENYLKNLGNSFLLCFLDVDHLKDINDRCGHLVGSEAILNTAKIIKKTFRETDLYCRFGGDEFIVLVLNADSKEILEVDTRFQYNLDSFNNSENNEYKLSVSRGYAVYDPESPMPLEEMLKVADKNMYEYKSKNKFKNS
ncbi:MAG: diguanylate cyclase [Thermodesulfobacteriota bacterium]